ncbi:hypothetical protein V8F06_002856 [Rhypophila decipiens]
MGFLVFLLLIWMLVPFGVWFCHSRGIPCLPASLTIQSRFGISCTPFNSHPVILILFLSPFDFSPLSGK